VLAVRPAARSDRSSGWTQAWAWASQPAALQPSRGTIRRTGRLLALDASDQSAFPGRPPQLSRRIFAMMSRIGISPRFICAGLTICSSPQSATRAAPPRRLQAHYSLNASHEMPDNENGHLPYGRPNRHSDYNATGGRQIILNGKHRNSPR
jgi:hypothetical protein